MKEYIISDTHFNDDKIINFTGRPFNNISDMDKTIIHNWRDLVTNDDTVYHLGDLSTSYIKDNTLQYIISLLNFKNFILIRGNHDLLDDKDYYKMGITKVYDYPIIIKDFIILSHEPKFLEINSPYCNLYGHTHQNIYTTTKGSTFYYNCCVDVNSFKPILLQYIIDKIQDLYKNNVLKHKFKGGTSTMSRSYKKHVGGTYCGSSDSKWKKVWHQNFRTKTRDIIIKNMINIDNDYIYPHINEVGDLWDAPSDGGSCYWREQTFEDYLKTEKKYEIRHYFNSFYHYKPLTLKELKREWITKYKGK